MVKKCTPKNNRIYVVLGTSFKCQKLASSPHVMKAKIRTGDGLKLHTQINIQRGTMLALKKSMLHDNINSKTRYYLMSRKHA